MYVPPASALRIFAFYMHGVFILFLWFWQQTGIFSLNNINQLALVMDSSVFNVR